jgi:AcrR family transcriptional regulator
MPRRKTLSDEAVLDAALKVMFRGGPGDFTLAAVSRETGVAPATLLQRFGSKRAMVLKAVARANGAFAEWLARQPVERSADAVIRLYQATTPGRDLEDTLADQLLWLREDYRDPDMNALAREHFRVLREAVAARMPEVGLSPVLAVRLVEAQWQGALTQWGLERRGRLRSFIGESLRAWFELAARR